jgi:hypothetical protein
MEEVQTKEIPDFETFLAGLEARDQLQVNRTTDACTWYYGKQYCMHERAYWGTPRNLPERAKTPAYYVRMAHFEPCFYYWTDPIYADHKTAKSDAKYFKGAVLESFYCDEANPTWFLSFDDFDLAAKHVYHFMFGACKTEAKLRPKKES